MQGVEEASTLVRDSGLTGPICPWKWQKNGQKSKTLVNGTPTQERRGNGTEAILEKLGAKNFPKLISNVKTTVTNLSDAQAEHIRKDTHSSARHSQLLRTNVKRASKSNQRKRTSP